MENEEKKNANEATSKELAQAICLALSAKKAKETRQYRFRRYCSLSFRLLLVYLFSLFSGISERYISAPSATNFSTSVS